MSDEPGRALDGSRRGPLGDLRRRVELTYRYHGPWSVAFRVLTFPLRVTPLRRHLKIGAGRHHERDEAVRWYKDHARPVTIVIPSYRDAERVKALVRSIRRTTDRARVDIVVADDGSGPDDLARLRQIPGIRLVAGSENVGFAANVNRGLREAPPGRDVVILNSDMLARRGWLACLQFAAYQVPDVGIVGAKLLYRDNRIQSAGTVRKFDGPQWFDHRYRFKPSAWGPANVAQTVLAVTGACMYVRREVVERVGLMDETYEMGYEDVDYCLRTWQAGFRVFYNPAAQLYHLESVTRGKQFGGREQRSQRLFWERWGDFFDARDVRTPEGALRVVYVTEDTGVGGGHRDIFEHLNRLLDRGHEVELWTLGDAPDWFELRAPVRSFATYADLVRALAPLDAIKVATWWNTAASVWEASAVHGIPVYFVQDIETSYYPDAERARHAVLASYRHEFRYMTISTWNRRRLHELNLEAALVPPGIDLSNFRPVADVERRGDMVLALGRSNPLKNLPLTLAAWRSLPSPRPELCLFGIEPELAQGEPGIRYITAPSDAEVNRLLNEATVFVQTSTHEGFCLPPLEAMATGCAVVCTDAHGNRDFCIDGENCLVPAADRASVTAALRSVLEDAALRGRLGSAGIATAANYAWEKRIDQLESFLTEVATPAPAASAASEVLGHVGRRPVEDREP